MSVYHAVLIDTVSIQKYIFQSRKLKENLGASYLVKSVYEKYLQEAVTELFVGEKIDFKSWENELGHPKEPFDIGYIGGGNALLLFAEPLKAKQFVKNWTKKLLVKTPGIITAVALGELNIESSKFKESKDDLFKLLQENKFNYMPQTTLPRHGITSECTNSGLSQEKWHEDQEKYVSSVSYAKLNAWPQVQNELDDDYSDILGENFCLTSQLEQLGQLKNSDSHIAIVHIDGNDMGELFKKQNSLEDLRKLSATVKKVSFESFKKLIKYIRDDYIQLMDFLGFEDDPKDNSNYFPVEYVIREKLIKELIEIGLSEKSVSELRHHINSQYLEEEFETKLKSWLTTEDKSKFVDSIKEKSIRKVLPIRQIILGGDDVTFVCDGKLGIFFAKKFIEYFEKHEKNPGITASAGVAIIKSKYPFYRGYDLAEQLCNNAKAYRRNNDEKGSFIDFHIAYGGLAGDLEEIRKVHYQVINGNLLFRPYKLISETNHDKSFIQLINNTKELEKLPNSKIKEFRRMLTLSQESLTQFVQELEYRGRSLPTIKGRSKDLFFNISNEKGDTENQTPYFDMIELMEFYPLKLEGDLE
ncbi:MAG: Cas10/Cmr2 second palm domain-containing protein [Candidatus Zhuqueibacterota bacterium]